jgi:hypothetical protein
METVRFGTSTLRWEVSAPGAGRILSEFGTYAFSISTAALTHAPPSTTPAPSTGIPTTSSTATSVAANAPSAAPDGGAGSASGPSVPLRRVTRSGHLTVVPASRPRSLVVSDSHRPGTVLTVLFAGLRAGTLAYPSVYREAAAGTPPPGQVYALVEDLVEVPVDSRGEASLSWVVPGNLTPGAHALWLESQPALCQPHSPCLVFRIAP